MERGRCWQCPGVPRGVEQLSLFPCCPPKPRLWCDRRWFGLGGVCTLPAWGLQLAAGLRVKQIMEVFLPFAAWLFVPRGTREQGPVGFLLSPPVPSSPIPWPLFSDLSLGPGLLPFPVHGCGLTALQPLSAAATAVKAKPLACPCSIHSLSCLNQATNQNGFALPSML